MSSIRIEPYCPSDLDEIMEIENVSFTAPWPRSSYEELARLDTVNIWVAKIDTKLVAYMLIQHMSDEIELHSIAVAPEFRRQGIARKLIAHMMSEAGRLKIRKIFLQVRPSNSQARQMYEKIGFRSVGIRRSYYRDNGEDALVMRLEIEQSPPL